MAKAEIGRLQTAKSKAESGPAQIDLIDNTLQTITQMQIQKKHLMKENEDLRTRVQFLESMGGHPSGDKKKYMEGAVSMGKKLTA